MLRSDARADPTPTPLLGRFFFGREHDDDDDGVFTLIHTHKCRQNRPVTDCASLAPGARVVVAARWPDRPGEIKRYDAVVVAAERAAAAGQCRPDACCGCLFQVRYVYDAHEPRAKSVGAFLAPVAERVRLADLRLPGAPVSAAEHPLLRRWAREIGETDGCGVRRGL